MHTLVSAFMVVLSRVNATADWLNTLIAATPESWALVLWGVVLLVGVRLIRRRLDDAPSHLEEAAGSPVTAVGSTASVRRGTAGSAWSAKIAVAQQ